MNPVSGSFARCVKHPSQFFTGFCSTCLVERLSNVDSVENAKNASFCVRSERVEISESVSDSQRKSGGVRVRKTLLSLFELDDLDELENKRYPSSRDIVVSHDKSSEISELGLIFESESKGLDVRTGPRLGASGSTGASQYASFDGKKLENLGDGSLKNNGISFWFQSRIPTKGLKWRRRSACKRGQMQEMCLDNGNGGSYMENKTDLQNSWDWRGFHSSSQISWEKPRHSWDGSMMSKALACSFSCLEEREDDSCKSKRSLPDDAATSDLQRPSGQNDLTKVNNEILADHNTHPPEDSFRSLSTEVHNEDSSQDITVSDVCRKKSSGWSRVWDWSITTPFREFAKKNGHVLERSLSESWRGSHKDNNAKTFHPNVEAEHNGTTLSYASFIRSSSRGIVAASGDRQGLRPDLQKMRDFKFNRSHSVHFSSPRYPENGLLRFYLTPLRTSRRNNARSKRRTSHSLARGFLGL